MERERKGIFRNLVLGDGIHLELLDYRGSSKAILLDLIKQRNGHLNGVYLDRASFLHLLELKNNGSLFSLRGANLSNIDLSPRIIKLPNGEESFAFFRLQNLDLSHAVIINSNLSGVLFENCSLRGTSLRNSLFFNTSFYQCDLFRTIFYGAKDLTPKQLISSYNRTEAFYDNFNKMISGFVAIHQRKIPRKKTTLNKIKNAVRSFLENFGSTKPYIGPRRFVDITQTGDIEPERKVRVDTSTPTNTITIPEQVHIAPPKMPNPRYINEAQRAAQKAQAHLETSGRNRLHHRRLSKLSAQIKKSDPIKETTSAER